MSEGLVQIGEVAERLGLSLRTIRHYEEVGLVVPERTPGGFRLYSETDIGRLALVKRMKPLGFSLEEMRDLLDITDRLAAGDTDPSLAARLQMFERAVADRADKLREQLAMAREFAEQLRRSRLDAASAASSR
ncbi:MULTISPECIES: MerR family transcriptional regulator [Nonomuraea]|jgi:DNA-binding transcriptional MerR regulator|uniref:MerR family transcriptional regulator n=2 Tax=Nonomuraea TaxID=83681 RepID=A0A4R4WSB7_9ACTN|nr:MULTISPECIES: MerR family transcriptional regulator [Nonomuraea]TDD12134.1 MerR family transcriptional regulator [Nonomuraea deserti]TDD20458.1 MerR family transcriptional regulator [Nonomuraea diastatica]